MNNCAPEMIKEDIKFIKHFNELFDKYNKSFNDMTRDELIEYIRDINSSCIIFKVNFEGLVIKATGKKWGDIIDK